MLVSEMAQYLNDQGIGVFDETGSTGDIFIMTMPSTPDDTICLYSKGGLSADGKLGYDQAKIEILVRGVNVITTQQKAQSIYNKLQGFHNNYFKSGGFWIVNCIGDQSAPNFIGKDENRRYEFSLNFTIEIQNFEGGRENGCN